MKRKIYMAVFGFVLMALLVMAATLRDVPVSERTKQMIDQEAARTGNSDSQVAGSMLDDIYTKERIEEIQPEFAEYLRVVISDPDKMEATLDFWRGNYG